MSMAIYLSMLAQRLPIVLDLLAFRAQPFVLYALFSRTLAPATRLCTLALYATLLLLLWQLDLPPERVLAGALPMLWFALCAVGVQRLRDMLAGRVISRGAVLVLCVFAFLVLPAILAPPEIAVAALVLGWDMMLGAYSYCCDTAHLKPRPGLRRALFFILIDPTLVYVERGRPLDASSRRSSGYARIALGLLTLAGYSAIATASALPAPEHSRNELAPYLAFVLVSGSKLVSVFLAHSGLASIQIGLMRLLGFKVGERYHYPLLARNPQEFWQRWNIWVGRWVQRYVFFPLATSIQRSLGVRVGASKVAAALLAFLAVGMLHDLFVLMQGLQQGAGSWPIAWTRGFLLFGLYFLVWLAAQELLGAARHSAVPWLRWLPAQALSFASWFLFMHGLLLIIWAVSPGGIGALSSLLRS